MNKRTAISIALAAAMAVAPLSAARAQTAYYSNPLFWPFLAAGAILGTAALIVTSPIRVVCADCLPPPQACSRKPSMLAEQAWIEELRALAMGCAPQAHSSGKPS